MPHLHSRQAQPGQQTHLGHRPPAQLPPPPPPTTDSSPPPIPSLTTNTDTVPSLPDDHTDDSDWAIGECISYNNVGPINPEGIEGYKQFICFRDTKSKYMFNYPVKTCNEEMFLYHLERVLHFFTSCGHTPRILRSDYFSTFRSAKATVFYADHRCTHKSSAPYQQWQNATFIKPSSATYLPPSRAKTFSGQTHGLMHSHTGPASINPSPIMPSLKTHQRRRPSPISICTRRPPLLPPPGSRTPLEIRCQERHWLLHG